MQQITLFNNHVILINKKAIIRKMEIHTFHLKKIISLGIFLLFTCFAIKAQEVAPTSVDKKLDEILNLLKNKTPSATESSKGSEKENVKKLKESIKLYADSMIQQRKNNEQHKKEIQKIVKIEYDEK